MTIESLLDQSRVSVRTLAVPMLIAIGTVALASLPATAAAQSQPVCGAEVKEEIAKTLAGAASEKEQLALESELYDKYQSCTKDAELTPSTFYAAARECGASVSNLGSTYFEEMSCSGYDPQRRQFASPIKIKQTFGFGAAPLPGSREYVLHCVADANGVLVPVGIDSVHLADAVGGQGPTWQFAAIVNANRNLQTIYPMDGAPRRARSILSWALTPTNCNYMPIWGNALNYRIRLDQ